MRPDPDPNLAEPSERPADSDPFLLDQDRIQALAPAELVRQGLRHFKEDRVIALGADSQQLQATVEDAESQEPVDLRLRLDRLAGDVAAFV